MATKKKVARIAGAPRPLRSKNPASGFDIDMLRMKGTYGAFGYSSASVATREGRAPSAGSGDYHQQNDRERLVLQARDFSRNNGIFKGMVERATNYVVGTGFGLQAKTADAKWNTAVEALWKSWWTQGRPEIRGMLSGNGVEDMVCREIMTCGEVGAVKTDRGLVQLIEAEQIKGKGRLFDGITKDGFGRPISYSVCPYGNSGEPQIAKAVEYSPEFFMFVTKPDRPSATRAVPPLQSVFPMLHRINDMCDSEAIAAQLMARLWVSITRENGPASGYNESAPDTDLEGADTSGRASTRILELDWATIFHGKPGEKIEGIERKAPGPNFTASLTMFLRLIGLPLGMPLEIVLLDWTKSNYSQSRSVLLQAFVSFIKWQILLEGSFHAPVYRWFIDLMVAEGKIAPAEDRYAHEWIKPTFPWIDQLAEATAYALKLDRGFCTQAEVLKSLNRDREEVLVTREREIKDAIAISQRIKDETNIDVPWQLFAGLACSVNAPPAPTAGAGGDEKKPPEDKPEEETDDAE